MGRILHSTLHREKRAKGLEDFYELFDQINGFHSWQTDVPEGYVLYPVRKLQDGEVIYFNFDLAKDMGLIPKDHPHILNKSLTKKILDTFSIRIINEFDQKQNIRFHPSVLKTNPYMATRYLQLQHANKRGQTSGDGRSVWNGEFTNNGTVWDVSSRGTGVTRLAPGAVEAQKPLKSGSTQFGYGCGLADIDELIGAAIMAEIFHNNGINTERILTIINFAGGTGIGVRAGKNLFRPAHLFSHLKQGNYSALRKATHYFIDRQFKNKEWNFNSSSRNGYAQMLNQVTDSFAKFTAQLDRNYIFAWLDWDGDNVLGNAGIIDYGSIRQFGLRHDEYRYDDLERFSTNLKEQSKKARMLIQTFAQLTDFLQTEIKKPIEHFAQHPALRQFDKKLNYYLLDYFLIQVGIGHSDRAHLLKNQFAFIQDFYNSFSALEGAKTRRKIAKVADGVNRPAIYNMRTILSDLPCFLLDTVKQGRIQKLPSETFFALILSESARGEDTRFSYNISRKINAFQKAYIHLVHLCSPKQDLHKFLKSMNQRNKNLCRPDRLTGDGILHVVDEILRAKKKNILSINSIQNVIDEFIKNQSLSGPLKAWGTQSIQKNKLVHKVLLNIFSHVDENKESL